MGRVLLKVSVPSFAVAVSDVLQVIILGDSGCVQIQQVLGEPP